MERKNIINQATTALRRSEVFLADSLLFGKIELDTHTHNYCNPRRMHAEG